MVSSNQTPLTFTEKPGIGSLASLILDNRIRIVSARSLKNLINLVYHKGILNRVEIEKGPKKGQIIVHAVSEDGFYA
jgi:hypothetical protein